MKVLHDTFTLEREYKQPPAKVFKAWSNLETKMKWFSPPSGWKTEEQVFEFRVRGREVQAGTHGDGKKTKFDSTLYEIVPDQRIVNVYDMYVDGKMISTSLCTLELTASGTGTALRYTEQGVFYDGNPEGAASRKQGTTWLLGRVAEIL
jgi:uncharacterized protein YndB with AHSA1/START domain